MATTLAELQKIGTDMNLTGNDLRDFIKDQQDRERDERAKAREVEREKLAAEERARKEQLEAEERARKEKLEVEERARKEKLEAEERVIRWEIEKAKLETEERIEKLKLDASERDRETERIRLEAEENARDFERQRLEAEENGRRERLEFERIEREQARLTEAKFRREEAQFERDIRERELAIEKERLATDVMKHDDELRAKEQSKNMAKDPKLPYFEESKDKMDSYLARFEKYATANKWPKEKWAINLSALLKGRALEVYDRLSQEDAESYDKLKEALLKNFDMTEFGFRKRFKEGKPEKNETFAQFVSRIGSYLEKWLCFGKVEKTYEGLKDFLVRDQLLECSSRDLYQYLKPKACKTAQQMATEADLFAEARGGVNHVVKQGRNDQYPDKKVRSNAQTDRSAASRSNDSSNRPKKCGICGGQHWTVNCWKRGSKTKISAATGLTPKSNDSNKTGGNNYKNKKGNGNKSGGKADDKSDQKTDQEKHEVSFCRVQNNDLGGNTLITEILEQGVQNGQVSPVHKDVTPGVCYFLKSRLPTAQGTVNGSSAVVLRDTGCTGVVVRSSLVQPHQYLDKETEVVLIDDSTQKHQLASIEVDCPFLKGTVNAICMDNPLYDLVVGNVDGSKLPDMSHFTVAQVTTRAQSEERKGKNDAKAKMKVPDQVLGVSKDEFRMSQESDPKLKLARELVESGEVRVIRGKKKAQVKFVRKNGLIYREYRRDERPCRQLVVPAKYRPTVLKMAHESIMAGHLGTRKTTDRVLTEFYWHGVCGDVSRHCRSCDVCQRTVPKGKVGRVPLGKMPLIDTPFKRVAVDIVGPIEPRSSRNKRYILTMIDYATRYPEAVALSNIDTETVAEALVEMFSRVGIPDEMLSDCGTQFTSDVMHEVSRLLSLQQLTTTPWNPRANGLCEKFNGTLKQMLKKMCAERPKDWDRYLPALLFAIREVPQESLGFSPFELMYGRSIRGPMSILRELWTGEVTDEDVKTTYQYVVDLGDRLESTCKLARESLKSAKSKQKHYYDQKTRERKFKVGDKVLLLLPTSRNKLLVQWKGPYVVKEVISKQDYRIEVGGVEKVFHANMLKQYVERKSVSYLETEVCTTEVEFGEESDVDESIDVFEFPSKKATQSHIDVTISDRLTDDQQKETKCLLAEFKDVLTDVPGRTNLIEHEIKLTSAEPIRTRNYPIPLKLHDAINKEVTDMLEMKVIEHSNSPYSSPIVPVVKPDSSIRLCIDYRKLNKVTLFDAEPMPNMEEVFSKMSGYKFFSKFDLTKGYYQVPLTKDTKPLTAFETSLGLMQFTVAPFGLVNSGATFCRLMRKVLRGLPNTESFVDDIWIYTHDWNDHLKAIRSLFDRLREARLTAKPSKCHIGVEQVECLGHFVSEQGLKPNEAKVKAIVESDRPYTKKQVRSFLGLVGFYRRFIPNFSAIAAPLTELTKNKQPNKNIEWGEAQEKAFGTLKMRMTNYPILRLPEIDRTFVLQTDASDKGLGAVLYQDFDDGKLPIAYASRKLLDRERNYSVIEKECLGIVWGVEKFHRYLFGTKFVLETDHAPLSYLQSAKTLNPRIMRWALRLQPYHFRIVAIRGRDNIGADYLSRDESAVV